MSTRMYAHLVAGSTDKGSTDKDSQRVAPVKKADRYKFGTVKTSVGIEGAAMLWLGVNDLPMAYVAYDTVLEGGEQHIHINYIKSIEEGRGYARALMERLYYEKENAALIDWGICHHPAALHLAEDFSTRYWSRTAYATPDEVDDPPF